MGKVLAVVALLSSPGISAALTSIIAVRTPDTLLLGADSLVTRWDGSEKSLGCKIQQSGEFFSAFALVTGVAGTDFDLQRLADRALRRKGPLRRRIQEFADEVQSGFTICLEALHRFELPFFNRQANHRTVSEAVFLGFEEGEPRMWIRWFVASMEEGRVCIRGRVRDCPNACAGGVLAVNLGQGRAEITALPGAWNRDIPGAIERFIEREIRRDPARAASPIAMVQIDRDGVRWIRPGACQP